MSDVCHAHRGTVAAAGPCRAVDCIVRAFQQLAHDSAAVVAREKLIATLEARRYSALAEGRAPRIDYATLVEVIDALKGGHHD